MDTTAYRILATAKTDDHIVILPEESQKAIVGCCIILVFVAMVFEWTSPEIAFLSALVVVCFTGVLNLKETLAGFSNESMITIGALFLVVGAVERTRLMDVAARKAFGTKTSKHMGVFRMLSSCFALSAFFNNTPLVALMIPIVRDWARTMNIPLSQLLIPLSYCVLAGGLVTMIGTSTNLTVQGLLDEETDYQFNFFAPAAIAIPCGAVLLVYLVFAAPYLLPNRSGLIREARDKTKELIAEVKIDPSSKFIGQDLASLMDRFGAPVNYAIKIRRRAHRHGVGKNGVKTVVVDVTEGSDSSTPSVDVGDIELGSRVQNITNAEARKRVRSSSFETKNKTRDAGTEDVVVNVNADSDYVQRSIEHWGQVPHSNIASDTAGAHRGSADVEAGDVDGAYVDVIAPHANEILHEGDIVFIASAQEVITQLLSSIGSTEKHGLQILDSNVFDLPGYGSELVELVLSNDNPFLGQKLSSCAAKFSDTYKVGIISTRPRDVSRSGPEKSLSSVVNEVIGSVSTAKPDAPEDEHEQFVNSLRDSRSIVLSSGDALLCIGSGEDIEKLRRHPDFFVASSVGNVPKPITWVETFPVWVFAIMIIVVATGNLEMCPASLAVAAIFLVFRWLKPSDIPALLDVRLLMLMGCALSFAKSISTSGLAADLAQAIKDTETSDIGSLFIVYGATLVITELVSNNAAAALMFPVALALADQLNVSYSPYAMVILMAATAAFMSPIGYQTHVMVWVLVVTHSWTLLNSALFPILSTG